MKTNHTKGKWNLSKKAGTNNMCRIKDGSNKIIADAYCFSERIPSETAEANAKLIAAAQTLLETLIGIRSQINYQHEMNKLSGSGKSWEIELKNIDEAIELATN